MKKGILSKSKVLLVDDQRINLLVLEGILRKVEAETVSVTSAEEALQMLKQHEFALMILDVQMPQMDGFELSSIINEDPVHKYTPIIFLSAVFTDAESIYKGYHSGAVDYMTKPPNPEILLSKVHIFLELFVQKQEILAQKQALNELNEHLEMRVQEEIQKHNEQQQMLVQKSKLESLGEIAAGMAHEINQPLAGLSMGLDNILFSAHGEELSFSYLNTKFEVLFEDIRRIRQIIEHVRVFSRDQKQVHFERIDLNEAVNNALGMVQTQYFNHGIQIDLQLAPSCPTNGNIYKLEQVLLNLLSNARYAIEKRAENETDPAYVKRLFIQTTVLDEKVQLLLEDNGTGIKKSTLDQIFQPFFTTKPADKGTGLGLSIVYGIMKEMAGEIIAESEVGNYTRFRITLPLAQ